MSITSIFSAPKPLSFFSSKEEVYANRVHKVAHKILLACYKTIGTILAMAAFIYLWQGSVAFDVAVISAGALAVFTDIFARILVSWNLVE